LSVSPTIGQKLTRLSILSSVAALLAASVALLAYDLHEMRSRLVRQQGTVATIIALNSASAVDFNDPEAARTTLAPLKIRPSVVAAGIVVDGRLFSSYLRDQAKFPPIPTSFENAAGHRFTDDHLTVFHPIVSDGRRLGTLFIQSDLREIDERLWQYASMIAIVSVAAIVLSILISRKLQATITEPILRLAAVAQTVSVKKDYSVRVPISRSVGEVEQLVATFNQMLTQIEQQHAHLQEAQASLEQRVEERTRELALRTEELEVQRRELAAANKELEAFSYSVSHDLRAPLRAIDGFSQALLTDYGSKLDQDGIHFLERVRAGTQKMSRLIDDMLDLARVTRRNLVHADVDVTAIAEEIAEELQARQPDRQVQFQIAKGLRALGDSHLLNIVLQNLMGNAWKFSAQQKDARIEIGQEPNGDMPAFYVRDNGAGFDMKYAHNLFGVFQRLHSESEFEGTGVGLATVQRIVHRHGGKIWAEAERGKGAKFSFTLGEKA
jgi:signal transduction histidine kinase